MCVELAKKQSKDSFKVRRDVTGTGGCCEPIYEEEQ